MVCWFGEFSARPCLNKRLKRSKKLYRTIENSIPVGEDSFPQDLRGHPVDKINVGSTLGAIRFQLRVGAFPSGAGAEAAAGILVRPPRAPLMLSHLP